MSSKLSVVLTWVECVAGAITIAIPAIREVVSKVDATKTEVKRISNDDD